MSILREEYHSIPKSVFISPNVDTLFRCYSNEFLKSENNVDEFVAMFLNIIRDFLAHKLNEETLSSLIHKSLFDERTKKYHYEPYLWTINDMIAILSELLDITWTKESSEYKEYLKTLGERLALLVNKYHKQPNQ